MPLDTTSIVSVAPVSAPYYPASLPVWPFMVEEGYVPHTEVPIPRGHSRYGGPVFDLPPGAKPPEDVRFAAQIDLSAIGPHDTTGLLPRSGHVVVFADIRTDTGLVVYADIESEALVRHVAEHEDAFGTGQLVGDARADVEVWSDRFVEDLVDLDDGSIGTVTEWSGFAGGERSKLLGWPVHCQWSQADIEAVIASDRVVLVQFGEGDGETRGFNDEGVFSVLIPRADLAARRFDRCEIHWGQT